MSDASFASSKPSAEDPTSRCTERESAKSNDERSSKQNVIACRRVFIFQLCEVKAAQRGRSAGASSLPQGKAEMSNLAYAYGWTVMLFLLDVIVIHRSDMEDLFEDVA